METIFSRRSIRKYTNKEITEEMVTELLKAGMAAPSAGNAQSWEFIIINDPEIIKLIPTIHPYSNMVTEASKVILVCGNLEDEIHEGFWPQDCSAATENILLAAAEKNLGAVWLGVYPEDDRVEGFKKLFDLPEHIIPFSLIPVGYPAEKKEANDRFTEDKIHRNQW